MTAPDFPVGAGLMAIELNALLPLVSGPW